MSQPSLPIDYTNLGYDSLRAAMLALAQQSLPEWTDQSPQDLGVLLVELFAYACDITLYYQTRIAGNLFPATSDEPDALVQLLRLIGYELQPPAPATALLRIAFDQTLVPPISVPAGTQFFVTLASGDQLIYETTQDVLVQEASLTPADAQGLRYFFPILVVQGQTVIDDPVAVSDGTPNQMYTLKQVPVIDGSIGVTVQETTTITSIWQEVATLAQSSPADRHFAVQRDAAGGATLVFGDGFNGLIPPRGGTAFAPGKIVATYRVGGTPLGNVPANTDFSPALSTIEAATNPAPAAGGSDVESAAHAVQLAPNLFRAQDRAVTAEDYVDLALQVPGVGKVLAVSPGWNQVTLFVAPSGQVTDPSELLTRDLLAFFEGRRMASTSLQILGPSPADIYLGAVVRAQPWFLQSAVLDAVEQAVAAYLAFDAVDFGQAIYLSKIYDVIQNLPQVASLTVFKFSRTPDLPGAITTNPDVATDGVIELAPDELPRPGYRDNPNVAPNPFNASRPHPSIVVILQGGVSS